MAFPPADDNPTDYGQQEAQRVAGFDKVKGFEKQRDVLTDGVSGALSAAVGYFFKGLGVLAVIVLKGLYKAMGQLDPAFGAIAATVVGNMFDVEIDGSAFASMTDAGARKHVGHSVGAALLKAMQGDAAGMGAGELEPSTAAAENFLGVMANLAIEGWAMDLVGEAETLGHITNLGELNDRMASVLGLGRLSRSVLRPFVKALIADPATWAVNKQYRPKMLSVPEAIRAMIAGTLDESTMREIAARDGLGDDAIEIMIAAERKRFSPADLDLLVRMELKERSWAVEQLRATGLDDQEANDRLVLEDAKALRAFQLAVAGRAIAAYADHRIDAQTLSDEIDHLGLDQTTLDRLHADAGHRRTIAVLHLTRGDVEAAIENGVLGISDYGPWLEARGYAHDDAITLELLLLAKLNKLEDARHQRELAAAQRKADRAAKLQAQQATRDKVAAEHAHWTGNLGEAERLVVRNIMPPSQYRTVLVDHGLSAGDADALVAVALQDRDTRAAAAQKRLEAAAKTKTPLASLAVLEHAVLLGTRSIDAFRAELQERQYAADDAQLLVDVLTRELADRTALQAKRDALAGAAKGRTIGLGQLEAAVLAGDATIEQYRVHLVNAKYSDADVQLLVSLLQTKLKERAFALERHQLAEQKLEASHVSLANEEKAVVDGILTMADYTAWLTAHGFDDGDVAVMTALLEEKLAKAAGGA